MKLFTVILYALLIGAIAGVYFGTEDTQGSAFLLGNIAYWSLYRTTHP